MKKAGFWCILLPVIMVIALTVPAKAAEPSPGFSGKAFDLGVGAGIWFAGDIYFGLPDDYYTKDSSLLLRGFLDAYLIPQLAFGLYANYSSFEIGDLDVGGTMYEFGVSIKPRFFLSPTVAFKPGLNVGYRSLTSSDLDGDADGLGVNLSLELQFDVGSGIMPFIDAGFLSQPAGGNADQDITWAPIIYVAGGIVF